MSDFSTLKRTLAYARLGLVSLTAAVVPITGVAQELCGTDIFEGEPDAEALMSRTLEFLDILETSGVVAFDGREGRLSVTGARQALQDGIGSASLLSCVVNADSIEFDDGAQNQVIACDSEGTPSLPQDQDTPAALALLQGGADPAAVDPVDTGLEEDLEADADGDEDGLADARTGVATGQLFCTTEVASFEQYLSSEA